MVKQEIKFSDGTRIFYEKENGFTHRFIEYAYTPEEKRLLQYIKDRPYIKEVLDKRVRKYNANKYYYLLVLNSMHRRLDYEPNCILCHELGQLCEKVGTEYDPNIVNKDFLHTFGKYWHGNEIQCAAFFATIYLAMLDMEKKKQHNPTCLGKGEVLLDCTNVLMDGLTSDDIAFMSGKRKKSVSYYDEDYYEDLMAEESRYIKYEDNYGFDYDDTIADVFDGFPEAEWNTD